MPEQMSEKAEVKMYSDFKSPYAYLAFDPGMALGQRFDVRVRWIPFQLRPIDPARSVLDLPISHHLKIHSADQLGPVCVGSFHVNHSLFQSARV